jgi:CRP-like cAMP-binding protein
MLVRLPQGSLLKHQSCRLTATEDALNALAAYDPGAVASAVDLLGSVPLFAGLDDSELQHVAVRFTEHTFPAGSTITTEGQRGARVLAFFLIVEGTATVTKDGRELAALGPGDHFGEIALFLDVPRMATVTAATDLRCLAMSSWEFRPLLEDQSPIAFRLLETMAQRLYDAHG